MIEVLAGRAADALAGAALFIYLGKKEEIAVEQTQALLTAQGSRISTLKVRTDSLEERLNRVNKDLSEERRRSTRLARALEAAVTMLRALRTWIEAGHQPSEPTVDLASLEEALAEAARPRRPPVIANVTPPPTCINAGGRGCYRSSPNWARTSDLSINSRTLCQLSYRGSRCSRQRRVTIDVGSEGGQIGRQRPYLGAVRTSRGRG